MAYTQQQLDDLRAAISEGALQISANGRSVMYRSINDMIKLERIMAAEIEGTSETPKRIYASFRGI